MDGELDREIDDLYEVSCLVAGRHAAVNVHASLLCTDLFTS